MRNEFFAKKAYNVENTDTRLSVRDFYESGLNQQIANNEMGGGKHIESF